MRGNVRGGKVLEATFWREIVEMRRRGTGRKLVLSATHTARIHDNNNKKNKNKVRMRIIFPLPSG